MKTAQLLMLCALAAWTVPIAGAIEERIEYKANQVLKNLTSTEANAAPATRSGAKTRKPSGSTRKQQVKRPHPRDAAKK